MTRFAAVNLSLLPAPEAIEQIDYEVILAQMKASFQATWDDLRTKYPDLPEIDTLDLQTDPLAIAFQVCAEREHLVRQVGNDKYKAATLAYATGANLDNKAAELGVVRKLLDVGDPNASPPLPEIFEGDDEFRFRAQLAWEALSVAGSYGAYYFQALTAHADVLDAAIFGPESGEDVEPGQVLVTILSREEGGVASPELLAAVTDYVSSDLRRPLTDQVIVEGATIETYEVEATIKVRPGASAEVVRKAAEDAVTVYTAQQYGIGQNILVNRLAAALYVGDDAGRSPVDAVEITSPAADIITGPRAAPVCTGIVVTVEVA